jgi:RCC1 and BTB domain-containing protein
MADITKWTLFSLLDAEFIERIKFALVFGSAGNEALIVVDDDRVYGLGTNACSCLGQCCPGSPPSCVPRTEYPCV